LIPNLFLGADINLYYPPCDISIYIWSVYWYIGSHQKTKIVVRLTIQLQTQSQIVTRCEHVFYGRISISWFTSGINRIIHGQIWWTVGNYDDNKLNIRGYLWHTHSVAGTQVMITILNKGNNKITELWAILQRESQNS
jgi:hypothetical protein